jgi:hypothetical protein
MPASARPAVLYIMTACWSRLAKARSYVTWIGLRWTNDTTLHGHPHPLEFPEGYPRTSIALYFYSAGLPVPEWLRRKRTTTHYLPLRRAILT